MDILKVSTSNSTGTYLGYRSIDRKRARRDFIHMKKKICSKLTGRKARILSQAGKMVPIKSNVASTPLFTWTI